MICLNMRERPHTLRGLQYLHLVQNHHIPSHNMEISAGATKEGTIFSVMILARDQGRIEEDANFNS